VIPVLGDASDEAVAERVADLAEEIGALEGWVNNAAVFREAQVHADGARDVLDAITSSFASTSHRRVTIYVMAAAMSSACRHSTFAKERKPGLAHPSTRGKSP
jgi:hypothetical protein